VTTRRSTTGSASDRKAFLDTGEGLLAVLFEINEMRALRRRGRGAQARLEWAEALVNRLFAAHEKLAVYGSLAPGKEHHDELEGVAGEWLEGFVRGELHRLGWGAAMGYPALRWDPAGERVPVGLLCAASLPEHWARLDRFEGGEYLRILAPVHDGAGFLAVANLYASR
jgi:gamma-glutamylcyclotransferase (GGCT)/AIG2-like uncharacterized protein YtfP